MNQRTQGYSLTKKTGVRKSRETLPLIFSLNFSLFKFKMEDLASYGITMKPEMQGLTTDQIRDLKLGQMQNLFLFTSVQVYCILGSSDFGTLAYFKQI
jgi:hypothetical protein